jgi:CheY-like chemotaxis protein
MRTVLIADDNETLRSALKLALEAAGYEVHVARNGAEALERQQAITADVLVTDLFMPEADGFELIATFRQRFPGTKIIAISGDARRIRGEFLSAAKLVGVDATLKKPFKFDKLVDTLRSLDAGQ